MYAASATRTSTRTTPMAATTLRIATSHYLSKPVLDGGKQKLESECAEARIREHRVVAHVFGEKRTEQQRRHPGRHTNRARRTAHHLGQAGHERCKGGRLIVDDEVTSADAAMFSEMNESARAVANVNRRNPRAVRSDLKERP